MSCASVMVTNRSPDCGQWAQKALLPRSVVAVLVGGKPKRLKLILAILGTGGKRMDKESSDTPCSWSSEELRGINNLDAVHGSCFYGLFFVTGIFWNWDLCHQHACQGGRNTKMSNGPISGCL